MPFWIVTGRICGDYEDTAGVFEADSEDAAIELFREEQHLRLDDLPDDDIYINTVARSDSPIQITS